MLNHPELLDRVFQPAAGTFPKDLARTLLDLKFPEADRARYEQLSAKAQLGSLTADEQADLDDYLNLNDFLVILKTKALASLSKASSAA
ncbi:MAG TPA: hypothetical protein VG711_07490 [Phycisphaerales bacterium]|jgi:hypothetical protein|nr:hypothetical protein [Phycisphaerales bacterium]